MAGGHVSPRTTAGVPLTQAVGIRAAAARTETLRTAWGRQGLATA